MNAAAAEMDSSTHGVVDGDAAAGVVPAAAEPLKPKRRRGPSRKTRELMERCRAEGYNQAHEDIAPMSALAVWILLAVSTLIGFGVGAWMF